MVKGGVKTLGCNYTFLQQPWLTRSDTFLLQPRSSCIETVQPTVGWALTYQLAIIRIKQAPQTSPQANLMETTLQLRISLPKIIGLFQVDPIHPAWMGSATFEGRERWKRLLCSGSARQVEFLGKEGTPQSGYREGSVFFTHISTAEIQKCVSEPAPFFS